MTTEQELRAKLKAALAAHRKDCMDGRCAELRPDPAVLARHQAVVDASSALHSWKTVTHGN